MDPHSQFSYLVFPPREEHTHTVIWFHGPGSSASELSSELFKCKASQPEGQPRTLRDIFPTIKWVFPRAPPLDMSRWFHRWYNEQYEALRFNHSLRYSGISQITDGLEEEVYQVPVNRIFLAWIGQGFPTPISACELTFQARFAGLIGLSSGLASYVPRLRHMPRFPLVLPTPAFLAHCADDEVIPIESGRRLRDILSDSLRPIQWKEYSDGGHWINEPQGVDDIVAFIKRNMYRY